MFLLPPEKFPKNLDNTEFRLPFSLCRLCAVCRTLPRCCKPNRDPYKPDTEFRPYTITQSIQKSAARLCNPFRKIQTLVRRDWQLLHAVGDLRIEPVCFWMGIVFLTVFISDTSIAGKRGRMDRKRGADILQ